MNKLSILISSKNEPYLQKTIESIFENATGDIEVLVGLDGWGFNNPRPDWLLKMNDERANLDVNYSDEPKGMRYTLNELVMRSTGDYLLKLDAHCMVAKGFDEQLIKDHKPNWVQVPRRKRLDAVNWVVINDGRPDVDYEYILFQSLLQGFIWATPDDERTLERKDVMIDDTMHFQGSCWFMTKEWFKKCNLFQDKNYGGFIQEPEEIILKTLQNGGEIKVNKNTHYVHWHKSKEERAKLGLIEEEMKAGHEYSFAQWKANKDLVVKFINKFNCPDFKEGWEDIVWPNFQS